MTKLYTVPRFTLGSAYALAQGEWGGYWGWVLKALTDPGLNDEQYSWLGGCEGCALWGGYRYFCEYTYTCLRRQANDTYHFGLIWQQGIESAHILAPGDLCSVGMYGYFDWRYYVAELADCQCDLTALEAPLAADIPDSESFRTIPLPTTRWRRGLLYGSASFGIRSSPITRWRRMSRVP
jgi:hypothetical protein